MRCMQQDKPDVEKGNYLYPKGCGQSETKGLLCSPQQEPNQNLAVGSHEQGTTPRAVRFSVRSASLISQV